VVTEINKRTAEVLSFIRCEVAPPKGVEDLQAEYKSARPFPYLVLDDLFPAEILDALIEEMPPLSSEKWVHERHERFVKSNLRSAADLAERSYQFISVLHSAAFLYFLSEITGIKSLLGDPYLSGGGYHVVPEGGKFDVHADRNTDHNSGLERRLSMLIYLNKNWKPEYGGQLELWNQKGTRCEKVIEPIFNRTVIFEIGDKNFHGVRPVVGGYGLSRQAFVVYFHTVGKDLVFHNSIYAPTIYQAKKSLVKRVAKEALPPFLFRALKTLSGRDY
jgi:hypothetical protein